MGPTTYFSINFSISKGFSKPFVQSFQTHGGYKVFQFGVLGLFMQFNYGQKHEL